MYKIINGSYTSWSMSLHDCLFHIHCHLRGLNDCWKDNAATVKEAMDAGYRIVRA